MRSFFVPVPLNRPPPRFLNPQVTLLNAFDKVAGVPDTYVPPDDKDTVPQEDQIHSWLMDERGRDQFAIRFADETEVYWNDAHQSKPDEVYKRNCWTESYVQWSTRGHYIATIHRQGAALWGGPGFPRLQRFAHPSVQFLDFSPFEKYLVTCSIRDPTNARESTTITVSGGRNGAGKRALCTHSLSPARAIRCGHALNAPVSVPCPQVRFFDIRSGRQVVIFQGGMEDFLLPSVAASAGARQLPPILSETFRRLRCAAETGRGPKRRFTGARTNEWTGNPPHRGLVLL